MGGAMGGDEMLSEAWASLAMLNVMTERTTAF